MRSARVVATLALLVAAATLTDGPSYAKSPKPLISSLAAMPATVGSGGATRVSASVSNAEGCTLSSAPAVTGLPITFSCESGIVSRRLAMPTNTAEKPANYTLTLTASGSRGKAKATVKVTVTGAAFAIEALQRMAGEASYTTAALSAKVGQKVEYETIVSNTGALALKLGALNDGACEGISPSGSTELEAGKSETFTCEHTLTTSAKYANEATIEGNEGSGARTSDRLTVNVQEPFFVEELQRIAGESSYTKSELTARAGQKVEYEVIVRDLAALALRFGALQDGGCENISPAGGTELQAAQTETFTCEHTLTAGAKYADEAAIEGDDGIGTRTSNDVAVAEEAIEVTAGGQHTCALLQSRHVACWGANGEGQLGNGTTESSDTPVEVLGVSSATQVTGGGSHSCALLASGHIDCWGANTAGQLGDGSTHSSDTAVEVAGMSSATELAAGGLHTCALLTSGHIDCWGYDYVGQLGNGTFATERPYLSDTPVEVVGIDSAVQVTAGDLHTCALLADGHIDCWGYDYVGQLGNGAFATEAPYGSDTPVEVLGVSNAVEVTGGGSHSCALLASGHIDCWGANEYGQLGNGTTGASDTSVEVLGIAGATQLSAGDGHTCALLAGGHVDCWGANLFGELGNGTATNSESPAEVLGTSSATQVAAGAAHSCALLASGRIDCWGANESGQLGDASTADSESPVQVVGL